MEVASSFLQTRGVDERCCFNPSSTLGTWFHEREFVRIRGCRTKFNFRAVKRELSICCWLGSKGLIGGTGTGFSRARPARLSKVVTSRGALLHFMQGNLNCVPELKVPGRRRMHVDCGHNGNVVDDSLYYVDSAENSLEDGRVESSSSLVSGEGPATNSQYLNTLGGVGEGQTSVLGSPDASSSSSEEIPTEGNPATDDFSKLEELRELLRKAVKELEVAQMNSILFEEKAQKISEAAIALTDEAENAWSQVNSTMEIVQRMAIEEAAAMEAVKKATEALSTAEAKLNLAVDAAEGTKLTDDESKGNRVAEDELLLASSIDAEVTPDNVTLDQSTDESDKVNEKKTDGMVEIPWIKEKEALIRARDDVRDCQVTLASCEAALRQIQSRKEELQKEVDRLSEVAEKARQRTVQAEEDVAEIMLQAEQAVAIELEATQRVNDAEIALQKLEKSISDNSQASSVHTVDDVPSSMVAVSDSRCQQKDVEEDCGTEEVVVIDDVKSDSEDFHIDAMLTTPSQTPEIVEKSVEKDETLSTSEAGVDFGERMNVQEIAEIDVDAQRDAEIEDEKSRIVSLMKKQEMTSESSPFGTRPESAAIETDAAKSTELETEKAKTLFQSKKQDIPKETTPPNAPKASLKKSSRFFSASFFSFKDDEAAFTPASVVHGFVTTARKELPKLLAGLLFLGVGTLFLVIRLERSSQVIQQPDMVAGLEEVTSSAKPLVRQLKRFPKRVKKLIDQLPHQEINEEEASLLDMLWLLLASVVFVPMFQKIPGGSPVLGYLAAGILIGPYGLSIIRHVHGTKAIAEFGVVFLLFNIGLELSVERLSSMKKYVFGLGSAQVLATAVAVGFIAHFASGLPGPAAIVIGNGLALSSTAVVLQVLQERGESTSRHGRATFSVLLFQDLAVVVLLILIPLVSPNSSKGGVGFQAIAEALGLAAVKAVVAIAAIIVGGRLFLRPIYKQIAENQNAEIFSANTLLVILGTSLLTARAGLSMALGAFLAGLLLAETEFSLQVESDIAPYRGLLLGLFFMTVGMSIDPKLLISNFPVITGILALLIFGKTILVALVGRAFGISTIAALRVGLLLAPGGEFAFVAFGEAVNQGIMPSQLSSLLFLVVGISMALTPWLAAGGQLIASRFEQHDVRSLLPVESETDDLQDHIIICGFGRVGQIIAQLLSERLIPFVALDVRSDRVAVGRSLDLPVYFGDAGSREVLLKVGAERACAAAITLDTPGANYRTVWALSKYFPNVKTFVRAHDVDHGLNLEKAGATAVVPETLEPSLQLAAAVLAQAKLPMSEIAATINEFRSRHLSELAELCEATGSSLGYGFSRMGTKAKPQSLDSDDDRVIEGTLAI
ncbi:K(+) efflux antiporter 1, chloroplastic-like [Nymphaea colorata]|nr:K(+) efflux antiporter 1, chloroplastic-like [Nymphaea colorata]XP_031503600.1 K(+) efflux antiporter 1, chloroplastic-like [Nymphaea colorata]